ncbi:MAG: TonB-dependent receptor [Prevotella sp.]|nr:TonB-dependent receptor [Prevotella sp.]
MKTIRILGLALAMMAITAHAQQTVVKGVLVDSVLNEGEPYASVRIFRQGDMQKPVAMFLTEKDGTFKREVKGSGQFYAIFSSVGKQDLRKALTLGGKAEVDMGRLLISDNPTQITGVEVVAQKPLVKMEVDKMTYQVAEDADSKASTVLDMLRKVPMVTVDGEDNIQVNGSSNFKVYVNGKPNPMLSSNPSLIMKNMPASMVKKVEVITNPGAREDAEGVSGILNLVTEGEAKTTGYTLTPSVQMTTQGAIGSLYGLVKTGRLTLSGTYVLGRIFQPDYKRGTEREDFTAGTLLETYGTGHVQGTFHYASLEASYEFSDRDLLSLSGGWHGWRGSVYDFNTTGMYDLRADRTRLYGYDLFTRSRMRMFNYSANVDYQHSFKREGQMLTLSYRLSDQPNENNDRMIFSNLENVPFNQQDRIQNPDNHAAEHTAQADLALPLGKAHTVATGVKYIYRQNNSDNYEAWRNSGTDNAFIEDAAASPDYRHRSDIGAAYGEYTFKQGPWMARAGLRYEYTHYKATYPDGNAPGFTQHFGDLAPSALISYNLSATKSIKASYALRLGRPDISFLSPYVQRPTPESMKYGNPQLESEHSHNFELSFNSLNPGLSVGATLGYTVQTDGLMQYSFLQDNILHTTFGNFTHNKKLNLTLFANCMLSKTTVLSLNGSAAYTDLKAYRYVNGMTARHDGFSATGMLALSQQLPAKVQMRLIGGGNTKRPELQGYAPGNLFYGLVFSRNFLAEDRLTLSLAGRNIFTPHQTFRTTQITEAFRTNAWQRHTVWTVAIGLSYRLGNLRTTVKKTQRTINSSETVSKKEENNGQSNGQQGMGGMGF